MELHRRILIMGPQGSGKGTQAELLAHETGLPALSMGSLLREEVAAKTPLGLKIKPLLLAGELVSEADAALILKHRVERGDLSNGFILDGYPRNLPQYKLADFLHPTDVIVIEIPEALSITRLSKRLVCAACGETFSQNDGFQVGVACPACGGQLIQRPDDKPEAIKRRLDIYETDTAAVIADYERQGIVRRVDGTGDIPAVHHNILHALLK